jgi:hypothetical protein
LPAPAARYGGRVIRTVELLGPVSQEPMSQENIRAQFVTG